MSKVLAIIFLVGALIGLGYLAYSGVFSTTNAISTIKQEIRKIDFPTGDSITIYTAPPKPEETTQQQFAESGTIQRTTENSTVDNSTIRETSVYGGSGQTYGRTTTSTTTLAKDTYKIGTPVIISAKLVKIIPNSCRIENNQQICNYVEPAKFQYLFYVTCEFRTFCALKDIGRIGQFTDNNGFLTERIDTNPSAGFTKGKYLATILANSEVKDASGRAYELKADYYFDMID